MSAKCFDPESIFSLLSAIPFDNPKIKSGVSLLDFYQTFHKKIRKGTIPPKMGTMPFIQKQRRGYIALVNLRRKA